MIMKIIWKRINDTGGNWLRVDKALAVLEYMVANGSERVIDDIRECASEIQALNGFPYIDSSGRDQGNDVRRRALSLVVLVNDEVRIAEARQKAAANRDESRSMSPLGGTNRPGPPSQAGVTPVNSNMHGGKSTVWAEARSRLTKLNIFGSKTNPPADVGGDNDALNRKEKRTDEEKGGGAAVDVNLGINIDTGKGGGPGLKVEVGIGMGTDTGGGPGMGMGVGMGVGMGKDSNQGVGMNTNISMGMNPGRM